MVVESLRDIMSAQGATSQTWNSDESFETLGIRGPDYTLKVYAPRIVHSPEGSYATYSIMLQTTSAAFRLIRSKTTRRFSEFVWLRKELNKADNWRSPPRLDVRRIWNLLDPKFISERRHQLEQWIHEVLSDPAYLSNSALHLFLQTEMPVSDIIAYLEGRYPADKVEGIWQNHGKLYDYQAHNLLHNSFRQEPVVINFCPSEAAGAHSDWGKKPLVYRGEDDASKPADPDQPDHQQPGQANASLEDPAVASALDQDEREASPDSGYFVEEVEYGSRRGAKPALSSSPSPSTSSSTSSSSLLAKMKRRVVSRTFVPYSSDDIAASSTAPEASVETVPSDDLSYSIN